MPQDFTETAYEQWIYRCKVRKKQKADRFRFDAPGRLKIRTYCTKHVPIGRNWFVPQCRTVITSNRDLLTILENPCRLKKLGVDNFFHEKVDRSVGLQKVIPEGAFSEPPQNAPLKKPKFGNTHFFKSLFSMFTPVL
jgi:hypothetical protein